jgi:hypothetical protein
MKLRDLILHNLRLKLFSLLIAVLVWETVHLATRHSGPGSGLPTGTNTNQTDR